MKIAIVGVGPRGLLIASHLIYYFHKSNQKHLDLQLFDKFPIGGRVWRIDQNPILEMNTIPQQITMFDRLSFQGPNLYQWMKGQAAEYIKHSSYTKELKQRFLNIIHKYGKDDYVPRCIFGVYLQWFFLEILHFKDPEITIKHIRQEVTDVQPIKKKSGYQVTTANLKKYSADDVVLNLGQEVNRPSREEAALASYARVHALHYFPIGYVSEKNLDLIPPQQNVIVRGMGLNFVDCMNLLTLGRGGHFSRQDQKLIYHPSGKEPQIIVGSREGVPYYCKATNHKINGHHSQPYFLSDKNIKKHLKHGKIDYYTFLHLLRLDMALVYYTNLVKSHYPDHDADDFKMKFLSAKDPDQVVKDFGFKPQEIINWKLVVNPVSGTKITNLEDYQKVVLNWTDKIAQDAKQGNTTASISSAVEVIRDARNQIRKLVNEKRFTSEAYIGRFIPIFNAISKCLSLGAPVLDMERYTALVRAGIIHILGPRMKVVGAKGHFMAGSVFYPKELKQADFLLEARNPVPEVSRSASTLTRNLFDSGQLTKPQFELKNGAKVTLDTVNVKTGTDQMLNKYNRIEKHLYNWGLPTEGVHWCTPNAPHPSGHDVNLHAANRIAKQLLGLPFQHFNLM